jgi:colanic acid/amylovoran biosynthesis glycosyltransferase
MQLGAVSETFIRRHLDGISPGRTSAVARISSAGATPRWPAFIVDRWQRRLDVRCRLRAGADRQSLLDRAIGRYLKKQDADVVLGEYLDQFSDFVPMLDRMGMPYVVQAHGIDVSASLRDPAMAERYQVYRSARAILTRCEFHRKRLISIGLPPEQIHVNAGGVDIPAAIPARGSEAGSRFLAVGRMVPQKAPIVLLESFRRAAEKNPDLTLDYIGGGPLFPAAQQFVTACGLQDRVCLHGPAPEETKHRLLAECGVFVQHSALDTIDGNEEGLPAAIQEGMANGMAVVSTRHSGIPEAVLEGETGLLVDENDAEGMAQAFLAVPSIAAKLGEAGYRRAAANYSWDHEKARLRYWLFDS